MPNCLCGKIFETDLSCSRHKSSCKVYREFLKSKKEVTKFIDEGIDHVICKYCGYKAKDITKHLRGAVSPHPSLEEYKLMHPGYILICKIVDEKRKRTCIERYNNPNYRNYDAQSSSLKRAFSNIDLKEKIRATKLRLYGDPGYCGLEKRKQTLMDKYGVDNPMKVPEIRAKASHILKTLYSDNPIERNSVIDKSVLEDLHLNKGKCLREIGEELGYSEGVISYWMKKHGIDVHKRVVSPKSKEFKSPIEIVQDYFDACMVEGKVLSFDEFGKKTEDKKKQRMKRLFNSGKLYHMHLEELKSVALIPDLWVDFIKKLRGQK